MTNNNMHTTLKETTIGILGWIEKMNLKYKLSNSWGNMCFGPHTLYINFNMPRIRLRSAARHFKYSTLFCLFYWVILLTSCPILSYLSFQN